MLITLSGGTPASGVVGRMTSRCALKLSWNLVDSVKKSPLDSRPLWPPS